MVITFCLMEKARRSKEDATFRGTGNMGEMSGVAAYASFGGGGGGGF